MWRTLFTSFMNACKHQLWPTLPGWCNYMEKDWETGFIICNRELLVVKNISPSWDGMIFLRVIRNVLFKEKYLLNGISSKYLVPAKRDNKFYHVNNLWGNVFHSFMILSKPRVFIISIDSFLNIVLFLSAVFNLIIFYSLQ